MDDLISEICYFFRGPGRGIAAVMLMAGLDKNGKGRAHTDHSGDLIGCLGERLSVLKGTYSALHTPQARNTPDC